MTRSYEILLKDKEIIYAEVMHEYNRGVCPLVSSYEPGTQPLCNAVRLPTGQSHPQRCRSDDSPIGSC
jgi:hypothetical protein